MPKTGRRATTHKRIDYATIVQKPRELTEGLEQAEDLMARELWLEARNHLYALLADYPRDTDVLSYLLDVNQQLRDWMLFQAVCEQLLEITPDDADVVYALAGAYIENQMPALAMRQYRQAVARFPYHGQAEKARKIISKLEGYASEMLIRFGVSGAEGVELAEQHEMVQSLLHQNRYPECREAAERLLQRWPRFTPALNNMSLACYSNGDVDQAIACIRRVLDIDAANLHALGNLVHFATVTGDLQQAEWAGERLKSLPVDYSDFRVKKAEAFSMLGYDQAVLEVVEEAQQAGGMNARDRATLHHLAAVAEFRLGHEHHARQNWREALALLPGLAVAQDNLADMRKPAGERHAPWAFPFGHWFTEDVQAEMRKMLSSNSGRNDDKALRRMAEQHPYLARAAPAMLDRGDSAARSVVYSIAMAVKSPEYLAALRDFGRGRRGPDVLRNLALQAAMQGGLIPAGAVRFWSQGEWRDVMLQNFEISTEPTHDYQHQDRVQMLQEKALDALKGDDGVEGERLLKQALEIEPDAPDLLYNLSTAYQLQERIDEMMQLVRQIHARYPDYFFARTALAIDHAFRGEVDEAHALLNPLLARKKLHMTEFRALCSAEVEVALAAGKPDAAWSWVEMLRQVGSETDMVKKLEQRIQQAGGGKRWTHQRHPRGRG